MKAIFSLRKHSYLKTIGTFVIAAALIVGVVGCEGEPAPEYALTMAVDPAGGGTATDETSGSPYEAGTVVDIEAVAAAGYEFVDWTAPAGTFADANAARTTFTMPAQNVTVTANFALAYDLTMAEDPAGGGTATDETGTSPYPAGTVVDIKAVPAAGYQFVMWTAPAGSFADSNAATTTFTMPAQDVTATAHFAGPLDHFKCYEVGEAISLEEDVYLEDQFVSIDATVWTAELFCNPTEKLHLDEPYEQTPLWNPDYHLMVYEILYDGEPVTKYVEVDNQFGLEELMVRGPVALAVPTQKGDHGAPLRLDHYLLYEVLGGAPADELVALNDQFMSEPDADVYEPVLLGNPVRKTHGDEVTEIINTDDHLLFYHIDVAGEFTTDVQIVNQFEEGTFDVYDPVLLAVPSTKTELPAPPPLDHFKGYTLMEPVPAELNDLFLEDQFSAFSAEATLAWEFCTPVVKNGEPLWYPENHLMLYDIIHAEIFPDWDVYISNQFGDGWLSVGAPVKLAVPTQKVDPFHPPPVDLDHFLLYEASGPPIELPVFLDDQFITGEEVLVVEPAFFANPVQKTHGPLTTPIVNPWGHLVFYRILGGITPVPIVFNNQFGELPAVTWESYYLAVPTEKWYYYEIPIG
jgi:hypothetical protein